MSDKTVKAVMVLLCFLGILILAIPAFARGTRGSHGGGHSSHMRVSHARLSSGGFHYGMRGGRRNPDRNMSPIRSMKKYNSYSHRQHSIYHSWVKNHKTR